MLLEILFSQQHFHIRKALYESPTVGSQLGANHQNAREAPRCFMHEMSQRLRGKRHNLKFESSIRRLFANLRRKRRSNLEDRKTGLTGGGQVSTVRALNFAARFGDLARMITKPCVATLEWRRGWSEEWWTFALRQRK